MNVFDFMNINGKEEFHCCYRQWEDRNKNKGADKQTILSPLYDLEEIRYIRPEEELFDVIV